MQTITTGTEKQNKWATDLRTRQFSEIEAFARSAYANSPSLEDEVQKLSDHLGAKDHAYWIDTRETHYLDIAKQAVAEIQSK